MRTCFLLLLLVSFTGARAQQKKPVLLDSIARSITSRENLSIEWETSFLIRDQRVKANHSARIKGNKYKHKTGMTTIICDGEFVSRDPGGKEKPIVSHCDTTADYNPVKVLTFFGKGYEVTKIKRYPSSEIKQLKIKTIDAAANLIQEAYLYFDRKGMLARIKFRTSGKFVNYVKIKKFDPSTIPDDREFVY